MDADLISRELSSAIECLQEFKRSQSADGTLAAFVDRLVATFQAGNKVLVAGNGGSMADAMHFAEEWTGRFKSDRRPYPVMALGDPTHLTCVANDYGYEHVFSRLVAAFAKPDDLVVLLSTSGNSPNLVLAAEAATVAGAYVVGFLGRGGGELASLCDLVVSAPGETSDRIQEVHMTALHIATEAAEARL